MDSQERVTLQPIRKGDKMVFRKLYDIYYQRLFLYAKSYLENDDEAEDIVQELFIHLYEKRKEVTIFSSLSSYFFLRFGRGIAPRRCLRWGQYFAIPPG